MKEEHLPSLEVSVHLLPIRSRFCSAGVGPHRLQLDPVAEQTGIVRREFQRPYIVLVSHPPVIQPGVAQRQLRMRQPGQA